MRHEFTHLNIFFLLFVAQMTFIMDRVECACPSHRFGTECKLECNCAARPDCGGVCGNCSRGYSLTPTCQRENVALGKTVRGSGNNRCPGVVDGDIDTPGIDCTLAFNTTSTIEWVSVDLGFHYHIKWLALYVNTNGTSSGISIYLTNISTPALATFDPYALSNKHCWSNLYYGPRYEFDIECAKSYVVRYVVVARTRDLSLMEIQVFYCTSHTFSERCDRQCNCYYRQDECDGVSGSCVRGCASGFMGSDCHTPCPQTHYGVNCVKSCNCARGASCDPVQGTCPHGLCDVRHVAENNRCQKTCPNNTYGYPQCNGTCHCYDNNLCDVISGHCHGGRCVSYRRTGSMCQQTCNPGKYLEHGICSGVCACANNDYCDVTDGTCRQGGCKHGWVGPRCDQRCPISTWGAQCQFRCHCKYSQPCSMGGICQAGCDVSYGGRSCNISCPSAHYVINGNCTGECRCANCTAEDGSCLSPCNPGYQGTRCQTPCPVGRYGAACSMICHCMNASTCDHVHGFCGGPCADGFTWPKCGQCIRDRFGGDCAGHCHCNPHTPCDSVSGRCSGGCADGWRGVFCQIKVVKINGTGGDTPKFDLEKVIILAAVAGALIVIIIVIFIYFVTRKRVARGSADHHKHERLVLSRDLPPKDKEPDPRCPINDERFPDMDSIDSELMKYQKEVDDRGFVGRKVYIGDGDREVPRGYAMGGDGRDIPVPSIKINDVPLHELESIPEFSEDYEEHDMLPHPNGASSDFFPAHNRALEEELRSKAKLTLPPLSKPLLRDVTTPYRPHLYEEPMEFGNMALDDELRYLFKDPNMVITEEDVDFTVDGVQSDDGLRDHKKQKKPHVSIMADVCKIPARVKVSPDSFLPEPEPLLPAKPRSKRRVPRTVHEPPRRRKFVSQFPRDVLDVDIHKRRFGDKYRKSDTHLDDKQPHQQENLPKAPNIFRKGDAPQDEKSPHPQQNAAQIPDKFERGRTKHPSLRKRRDSERKLSETALLSAGVDQPPVPLLSPLTSPSPMTSPMTSPISHKPIPRISPLSSPPTPRNEISTSVKSSDTPSMGKGRKVTRSKLLTHPDDRDEDDPSLVKNWSSVSQNSFLAGWES